MIFGRLATMLPAACLTRITVIDQQPFGIDETLSRCSVEGAGDAQGRDSTNPAQLLGMTAPEAGGSVLAALQALCGDCRGLKSRIMTADRRLGDDVK